jgi:hypothetical protein
MGEIVKREEQGAMGDKVLALIRTEFPEYHPLLAIARLAHHEKVKEDPRLALECHKTLVKYVTPELKSIEVKADIQSTRRVIVSMFDGAPLEMGNTGISHDTPVLTVQADPMWSLLESPEEIAA